MIALGHHTDLVVARTFESGTYACLLITDLFQRGFYCAHGLWVVQQFRHRHAGLLYLGKHLWQAQVVGLSHEEGNELVEPFVFL